MTPYAGSVLFFLTLALLVGRSLWRLFTTTHMEAGAASSRRLPGKVDLQASGSDEASTAALWMRVVVTLIVLLCALYIILSRHYEADQQKWAFGVIGTVLGYWLKS